MESTMHIFLSGEIKDRKFYCTAICGKEVIETVEEMDRQVREWKTPEEQKKCPACGIAWLLLPETERERIRRMARG